MIGSQGTPAHTHTYLNLWMIGSYAIPHKPKRNRKLLVHVNDSLVVLTHDSRSGIESSWARSYDGQAKRSGQIRWICGGGIRSLPEVDSKALYAPLANILGCREGHDLLGTQLSTDG
jgi:hypothetical protein